MRRAQILLTELRNYGHSGLYNSSRVFEVHNMMAPCFSIEHHLMVLARLIHNQRVFVHSIVLSLLQVIYF